MREIVVKNLTSDNHLQRDCVVTELLQQGSYTTRVTRRCTYDVKSRTTLPAQADAARWARNLDPAPPRQVYVTKDLDPDTQAERVVYKVLGHFYVVWGQDVYCIGYRHILAMDVASDDPLEDDLDLPS